MERKQIRKWDEFNYNETIQAKKRQCHQISPKTNVLSDKDPKKSDGFEPRLHGIIENKSMRISEPIYNVQEKKK